MRRCCISIVGICFGRMCCTCVKIHGRSCLRAALFDFNSASIRYMETDIKLFKFLEAPKDWRSRMSRRARPSCLTRGLSDDKCSLCRSEATSRSRDIKTASFDEALSLSGRNPRNLSKCLSPPCFKCVILDDAKSTKGSFKGVMTGGKERCYIRGSRTSWSNFLGGRPSLLRCCGFRC